MRCGNRLIELGDTKFTVLEACGEPMAAFGSTWIYDQGTGTLLKILTFYQDKLQSIELGDRRQEEPLAGTPEIFHQR